MRVDSVSIEPSSTPSPEVSADGSNTRSGFSASAESDASRQTANCETHAVCRDPLPVPVPWRHPVRCLLWLIGTGFGLVSLIVLLAVVAAIPIVNLYALGYLLDVEGRLARTGRFRNGFPLVPLAARLGQVVIGCWLWIMPIRILASLSADAEIIESGGRSTTVLHAVTIGVAVVVALHLCLALARGGRLTSFFRPLRNLLWLRSELKAGVYLSMAERRLREVFHALGVRHHFWLGLRGFVGTLIWLIPPTVLFAAAERTKGGQILVSILGGLMLVVVLCHLPFLQAQFAAENRLRALFDWRTARRRFRQAPLAFLIALVVLYALATPLYLAKVRLPPQDAMWLLTVVFVASIWPTRLMVGWAYGRAVLRGQPVWPVWIWLSRLLMVPLVSLFVILLFFTQFIDEHGKLALFEHHALLLPVPF